MGKKNILFKISMLFIFSFIVIMPSKVKAQECTVLPQKNVEQNKSWKVKFSSPIDKNTINNQNVYVLNKGNKIISNISLGDTSDELIINIPTLGYNPGEKYTVVVTTNVKSKWGTPLNKEVRMDFNIENKFEDGSSFENLPQIEKIYTQNIPIMTDGTKEFYVKIKDAPEAQVRLFLYKSNQWDTYSFYKEITSGYTEVTDTLNPIKVTYNECLEVQNYMVVAYVKSPNGQGKYKDSNTDYDNYSRFYFRAVNNGLQNEKVEYKKYDQKIEEEVNIQYKNNSSVSSNRFQTNDQPIGSEFKNASKSSYEMYLNPKNFIDDTAKYIFMRLDYVPQGVKEETLNESLKGCGKLENQGKTFLKAAIEKNINPAYLIMHALHETGNGTSILSKGMLVSSVDGKSVEPKIVYNFFGIKAFDSNPNKFGSEHAYKQGWFTPEAAIIGGAEFIAKDYINNSKNQNTLYKIKWDLETHWHQYATDLGWPIKQAKKIKAFVDKYLSGVKFIFEIPEFSN